MSVGNVKTALVTGANGGIGRAIAHAFLDAGFRVIGTDRGERHHHLECDEYLIADLQQTVEDPDYAERTFKALKALCPDQSLHALVNNAAIQVVRPVRELNVDDWTTTLNINLIAPFLWAQAFLSLLTKARGSVVNISSIHAQQSKAGFVAYATSKAGVSALTRNMAIELGSEVRINAIEPAAVRTDMLVDGFMGDETRLRKLDEIHPIGRIAEPEEIARVAVFLCSADASFLQGSVVSASGGIHNCLHDPD